MLDTPLLFSIGASVLASALLLYARPLAVFAPDGTLREFGCGPKRTLLPFAVLVTLAALVAYIFFAAAAAAAAHYK